MTKHLVYGGLWTKMQIEYIERRFGRKLKREEKEGLIAYFNEKLKYENSKNRK